MNMSPCPIKSNGFTLAELLIALALLGIIAAFTIPKVLQSSAEQEKVAKLRETVATLEQAWYNKRAANQVTSGSLFSNIVSSLNTTSASGGIVTDPGEFLENFPSHPCLPSIGGFEFTDKGHIQFANGVVVINAGNAVFTSSEMSVPQSLASTPLCIDINGTANPNQLGQDVFWGNFNPWGDFDFVNGAFTFNTSGKAFLWGSETQGLYDIGGAPLPGAYAAPTSRVGYWLTR